MAYDTSEVKIVRTNYSQRVSRGTIILPSHVIAGMANLKVPTEADLVTADTVQKYPIGVQLRMNGKLYRYSKAGEAMAAPHFGFLKCARTICPGGTGGGGSEAALYADAAAGATTIYIGDTADRAENYYEDGMLVVMSDTYGYQEYRIIGNEVAASADCVKIYIAEPGLKRAHTTTGGTVAAYRSPYIDVRSLLTSGNQNWFSAVGLAHLILASGNWFWLQTAGPAWGTGASTWPGQTAYRRTVFANTDGSLIGGDATAIYYQPVGYLLSGTQSDYGDVYMMMQLDQ